MKTQASLRSLLRAGLLTAMMCLVASFVVTARADITVDTDTTWSGTYSYTEDVYVISGAKLTLDPTAASGTSGNWYVNGSTIASTHASTGEVVPDYAFGSGTLHLTDSTLTAGVDDMNVSCPVVFSGNNTINGGAREIYFWGDISGSGTITEELGWSIFLRGDNSAYTGDWILKNDYTWLYNSSATAQAGWAGSGDYTFGSGTITIEGGMFALGTGNAYVYNDVILSTAGSVFSKSGSSLTLLGDLSGAATFNMTSSATQLYNLRGDNSDYTGAWNLQSGYVSTDNTSAAKVLNSSSVEADSRFGTGTITLNGGGLRGDANGSDTSVYVHNNITVGSGGGNLKASSGVTLNLTGPITATGAITATDVGTVDLAGAVSTTASILNSSTGTLNVSGALTSSGTIGNTSTGTINVTGTLTPQTGFTLGSTGSGKMIVDSALAADVPLTVTGSNTITLNGALTGSEDITVTGGRLRLFGTTTGYSGDWYIDGAKVVINGSNAVGTSFGTGTVYLEGNGAAIVGFSSNLSSRVNAYVYNSIVVTGKNYLRSDGDSETVGGSTANYQVTLSGPISSTDTSAMLIREGGGYRWDVYGNNTGYQGNWLVKSDFLQTNNSTSTAGNDAATHTDVRFGSGTIYMQSSAGIQSGAGVIYNDVTVQAGNTGRFRNGDFSLYGTVTADGTLGSGNAAFDDLGIYGMLQGKGNVSGAEVIVQSGGVLDPGQVGVVYYTESSHTYTPQADDLTATLTLNSGLAINPGGMLNFDVLSPTDFDTVVVNASSASFSDDVDLTNATIQVSFGEGFDWITHYAMNALLIDTEGTVTGLESATIQYVLEPGGTPVDSLPDTAIGGLSLTSEGLVLAFQTVPEPSIFAMLAGLGGLGLLGFSRRRKQR